LPREAEDTCRLIIIHARILAMDGDIEAIPAENMEKTGIGLTICGRRTTHRAPGFA